MFKYNVLVKYKNIVKDKQNLIFKNISNMLLHILENTLSQLAFD